jgi:hypothetical protein
MDRQYLSVPVRSVSPERLFISVGLVKSDLRDSFLDTTGEVPFFEFIFVYCQRQSEI